MFLDMRNFPNQVTPWETLDCGNGPQCQAVPGSSPRAHGEGMAQPCCFHMGFAIYCPGGCKSNPGVTDSFFVLPSTSCPFLGAVPADCVR